MPYDWAASILPVLGVHSDKQAWWTFEDAEYNHFVEQNARGNQRRYRPSRRVGGLSFIKRKHVDYIVRHTVALKKGETDVDTDNDWKMAYRSL